MRMSTQRLTMKADIAILTSGNLRILDNPSLQYFKNNEVVPVLFSPFALSMEETAAFEDLKQRLDSSKTVQIHSEDEMKEYIDGQKQKNEEVVIAYCTTSVEPVAGISSHLLLLPSTLASSPYSSSLLSITLLISHIISYPATATIRSLEKILQAVQCCGQNSGKSFLS